MQRPIRVSLISEGVLPTTCGGVGRWLSYLIHGLDGVKFSLNVLGGPPSYRHPQITRYRRVPLKEGRLGFGGRAEAARRLLQMFSLDGENPLTPMDGEKVKLYRRCPSTGSRRFWREAVRFYQEHLPDRPYAEFFRIVKGLLTPLTAIFKRFRPDGGDVYHALNSGFAGLAGVWAKALSGRPLLVTVHGVYEDERGWELRRLFHQGWKVRLCLNFFQRLCEAVYQGADRIVAVCEANRRRLLELGAPEGKVEVVENPVDGERFKPDPHPTTGQILVGTVTRIVPVKGLRELIQAAGMLAGRMPNLRFVVVGPAQDPEYFGECLRLVERLGLSDRFRFVGEDDPLK